MGSMEVGRMIGEAAVPRRARWLLVAAYAVLAVLNFVFEAAYPPGALLSVVPPEFAWVHGLPKITLDFIGTGFAVLVIIAFLNLPRVRQKRVQFMRSRHRRAMGHHALVGLPDWLFDPRPSAS